MQNAEVRNLYALAPERLSDRQYWPMQRQLSLFDQLLQSFLPQSPSASKKSFNGAAKSKKTPEFIVFDGIQVQIKRRPYKRRLAVHVYPQGHVVVSCGASTLQSKIADFLQQHSIWLQQKLKQFQKIRDELPVKNFVQGEEFLLLGERHILTFTTHHKSRMSVVSCAHKKQLIIHGPEMKPWSKLALQQSLRKHYQKVGRQVLLERVGVWATIMGLQPRQVSIRGQKTRWGSCSSQGSISLNWRLAVAPPEVIDYVVIHELAHLKHHNHSLQFWALVAVHCPHYQDAKKWLKSHLFEFEFLNEINEL